MWSASKLRELIEREGRTRKWLALQIGITPGSLDQILANNSRPSLPVVKLMAQALKCTEHDIDPNLAERTRRQG